MRNVVGIDPGHRGAGLHRQGGWIKGEIGNLHLDVGGQGWAGSKRHQHDSSGECRANGTHGCLRKRVSHIRHSASVMSVMASGLSPMRTSTLVMPRTERSWSAGTVMGPGEGAVPGDGCGKQVERAV